MKTTETRHSIGKPLCSEYAISVIKEEAVREAGGEPYILSYARETSANHVNFETDVMERV